MEKPEISLAPNRTTTCKKCVFSPQPNPAPTCNASIKSEWEPSKFLEISPFPNECPNEIHDGKMGRDTSELAGKLQVKEIDDVGSLSDKYINID
jgi:hypothetical protein